MKIHIRRAILLRLTMPRVASFCLPSFFCLASLSMACLEADQTLLCQNDDDCPNGETCELVSGLCSPSASVSRFASDLEAGRFGASGAFDCPIIETVSPGDARPQVAPGRATVLLSIDESRSFCADATVLDTTTVLDTALNPRASAVSSLSSLRTGCTVSKQSLLSVGRPGEQQPLTLYTLEFSQIDTTADNPVTRLTFHLRGDTDGRPSVRKMSFPADASAEFQERCTSHRGASAGTSALTRVAVGGEGDFEITDIANGRVSGRFDVNLSLIQNAEAEFGEHCTLPRDCSAPVGGCAIEELASAECTSGTCIPDLDDPSLGFCSARCDTSEDCSTDENSNAYCLVRAGESVGRCIRLCDPGKESCLANNEDSDCCPTGSTCRSGDDFPEFFGEPGPPRCLDECIPTRSSPNPPAGCARPASTPSDGGLIGGDGGPFTRDGGIRPPGDAGGAPTDGGLPPPPDAGGGSQDGGLPPPPDAGGGSQDSGLPPPADGGGGSQDGGLPPLPDGGTVSSALGLECTGACPAGFLCASTNLTGTTTKGFCTKPCPSLFSDDVCQAGYQGAGVPVCGLRIRDVVMGGEVQLACVVACGPQFEGTDGQCPTGLTCRDLVHDATRLRPPDGTNDFCSD